MENVQKFGTVEEKKKMAVVAPMTSRKRPAVLQQPESPQVEENSMGDIVTKYIQDMLKDEVIPEPVQKRQRLQQFYQLGSSSGIRVAKYYLKPVILNPNMTRYIIKRNGNDLEITKM